MRQIGIPDAHQRPTIHIDIITTPGRRCGWKMAGMGGTYIGTAMSFGHRLYPLFSAPEAWRVSVTQAVLLAAGQTIQGAIRASRPRQEQRQNRHPRYAEAHSDLQEQ